MEDMFTLFIMYGSNRKTTIRIDKNASVEDLLKVIANLSGIDVAEQRIIFATKELQINAGGKTMHLTDYGIHDRAELFQVFSLIGGNDPDPPESPVSYTKQLPDDVELSSLPDMITWDDDPNNQRAKMPCGHAIGPESLTAYCRSLLSAGKCQFHCPYIDKDNSSYFGQVWEYFIVRRLAVLNDDEMKEVETRLANNYLRKSIGVQECPKCTIFCTRKNPKDRRVVCPMCRKQGGNIDFCWYCLGDWKTSGTTSCGNTTCTGKDPRLKILGDAPKKSIVGVDGCPSIRACPKCGLLIQHIKACKHMKCRCDQNFCFICLKKADSNGKYQCGSYNSPCEIAPIQTQIIGADADDDATAVPAAPAAGSTETESSCAIL